MRLILTLLATTLLQAVVLHSASMAILCALGIAFSTRLSREAAVVVTWLTTGTAFLLLPRVPAMLVEAPGPTGVALQVLYYLLPHFELFDLRRRLVHGWGCADWPLVAGILVYAVLMTTAILTLAWLAYRKRRFSRGDIL